MTSPVDIVNQALAEIGAQATVSSINPSDGSAEGDVASLFYSVKVRALLRSVHWNFAKRTINLSQLVTAIGAPANPPLNTIPPPPWLYAYTYPSDALIVRYLLPGVQQAAPVPPLTTANSLVPNFYYGPWPKFSIDSWLDQNNTSQKVISTNITQATAVYTTDLSQSPDLWDALFWEAAVATLAAYFVNALARNNALMQAQVQIAQGALANARDMNGNEALSSADHMPDWMIARGMAPFPEEFSAFADGFYNSPLPMGFPGGSSY